ncbi:MAG: RDD family protein [Euryarchaeota archaeon]|nr:RDD family protein [Euryarchaeota archaeon]
MQTGFEIMDYDKHLKELWLRRTAAGIFDFVVTFVLAFLIVDIFLHVSMIYVIFLQGPVWYIYSVIFDLYRGKTPGKYIFKIRAVAFIGGLSVAQAFLRNLTKLNALLVLADVVAGLSTEGDPRQRYVERVIDSLVITERVYDHRITKFSREDKPKEELVLPK